MLKNKFDFSEAECGSSSCSCKGDDVTKRDFLKGSAYAAGGISLTSTLTLFTFGGSAVQAKENEVAISSKQRWGMLIDAAKCDEGCDKCVSACSEENGWKNTGNPLTDTIWIRKVKVKDLETANEATMPIMCQHCEKPPCVDVCPTGASFRRDDGIVLVDRHICIGCRYCMMACPYKARSFAHEAIEDQKEHAPRGQGCVESCTLCVHKIDKGEQPACVSACSSSAGGAMLFGDLNDPESEISQIVKKYATTQIRADLGLNVGVRYQNI